MEAKAKAAALKALLRKEYPLVEFSVRTFSKTHIVVEYAGGDSELFGRIKATVGEFGGHEPAVQFDTEDGCAYSIYHNATRPDPTVMVRGTGEFFKKTEGTIAGWYERLECGHSRFRHYNKMPKPTNRRYRCRECGRSLGEKEVAEHTDFMKSIGM